MIPENTDNPCTTHNKSPKASICIAPMATKSSKPNKISYSAFIIVQKYFKRHKASQNSTIWRYINNTDTVVIVMNLTIKNNLHSTRKTRLISTLCMSLIRCLVIKSVMIWPLIDLRDA